MDFNAVRRASSAGYRLPERSGETRVRVRAAASQPPAARRSGSPAAREAESVQRDRMWAEMVQRESRGARKWEKNWGFLTSCDQEGRPRTPEPPPAYVSLFSDRVPNTSGQAFGSRVSTPLGKELIRLDRLLPRYGSHHKRKQDPEITPC